MKRKSITPAYYKDFLCKGSECSENCCIGWKIEIDGESLKKYAEIGGELGADLRENIISDGSSSHFCLKNGRCAFLDESNLCRLISTLGEDILCDICREHPRFYIGFPGGDFLGVGLCCEAAADLVLSEKSHSGHGLSRPEIMREAISLLDGDDGSYDSEIYERTLECLKEVEESIHRGEDLSSVCGLIMGSTRALQAKIDEALYGIPAFDDLDGSFEKISLCDFISDLEGLEYLTDEICERLSRVNPDTVGDFYIANPEFKGYLGACVTYFADRYILRAAEDMDAEGKGNLVLCLTATLCLLLTTAEESSLVGARKICTLISRELEYNEENAERLSQRDASGLVEAIKKIGL